MKVLCLSDLHLREEETADSLSSGVLSIRMKKVRNLMDETNPDVIVLTGDTVSSSLVSDLSQVVHMMFGDSSEVMVTIGNHECWGRQFKDTVFALGDQKKKYENIHFLDIEDKFEKDGVVFVGGMLFFDGSMAWSQFQGLRPWNGWQDWRIQNVHQEYKLICSSYIEKFQRTVEENLGNSIFLCTHHLSDERLNGHEPSVYSFYSGVKSLIPELHLSEDKDHFFICGHTHRRVISQLAPNIFGVNVGSDYNEVLSYTINTEDFRI